MVEITAAHEVWRALFRQEDLLLQPLRDDASTAQLNEWARMEASWIGALAPEASL